MFLYQIALEDRCWYVGTTVDIKRRINEHVTGDGAQWTRLHKPLDPVRYMSWEIPDVSVRQVEDMEDVLTVALMKKYGIDQVRGGYRITCCKMKKILPRSKAMWIYLKIKFNK